MNNKSFLQVSAGIFAIIAVLQLLRIIYGWEAVIGGWAVPMWLSWLAVLIGGTLSYSGFRLAGRK